ncbi:MULTISPECIES: alpha/beta hydrolase [Agrobacterium tumefaciens complex]|uniref:Alpha/beta hydrolase n=1 Tax=Agrobacterium radiobacter TaxID=362 RepID=A0ABD5LF47_AGRRD|nr:MULTISPECIES: alpha/beta hydrolase [Agrobacterium tumefaciens complex]MCP2133836.1 phospholipase/carboxylesterase [Rhizobium sp. SLBN-94]EPR22062.1 esterase [Agrobacterium radiobacter DSM 30147]KAB0460392.1 alpha/beta hydrolase [Agrobacterium tumefaciens]KWT78764.1 esterase [Agrobacterium radiobacter]NIB12958.1 alpha/beta hydrolase [Agrobacterium radiobacter]
MTKDSYFHKSRAGVAGAPLFVLLHGTGGDENQFFAFGSRLLPEATILSPVGDVSEHGAARFFRRTGEGVYDMADLQRATEKLADFVKANREHYQAGPVIGLGFSNGANILANVLIEQPELFDAAVLMHPLIPFEPKTSPAKATRRVLITAGERDPICPVPLTKALEQSLKAQGGTVETVWHPGGHEIRSGEIDAVTGFLAAYGA